jgi:GPI mannosyltransferase 2
VAYSLFCQITRPPQWCSQLPPSIYTHVQGKYWDVGFLRYWTPAQLPNILLAAPVLSTLFTFTLHVLRTNSPLHLSQLGLRSFIASKNASDSQATSLFTAPSLTPHAIHTFLTSCILLFAAHTQIALRFASAMPTTYWAAAWLLVEKPAWGRAWVVWSIVWGSLSVVLWVTFLPPA